MAKVTPATTSAARWAEKVERLERNGRDRADHARAMTDLGLALQARGDLGGAEALFRRAAQVDPRIAGPWLGLGDLYACRGERAAARQAWQRFLELARYGVHPGQRERVEQRLREGGP